jgi:hypothetical protein
MRSVRPGLVDGKSVLELRPKIVWRLLSPTLAVGALVLGWGDWRSWQIWLTMAWLTALAIGAQRSYIRVEQGTIFRRGLFRWDKPLVLDSLIDISLQRRWGRGDNPHVELSLESRDGTCFSFQPRWWTNADQLLHIVAVAASANVPDPPPRGLWKLNLNAKTRERLAEHL